MKKALLALTVFGLVSVAGPAQSTQSTQSTQPTQPAHSDTKKPMPLWLCSDYLAVDESFQPTALGFAEAINRRGKPEAEVLDMEGIAKVTPEILTYCRENPRVELHDALDRMWDKIK